MARVLKGSHSLTCRLLTDEPYLPLPSQPKLVLIDPPRRDGRLSWPWVAGWLHTEISVRHRELNSDTVAHLSTNRARRRLTSLIEANALTTTPDRQNQTGGRTVDRTNQAVDFDFVTQTSTAAVNNIQRVFSIVLSLRIFTFSSQYIILWRR